MEGFWMRKMGKKGKGEAKSSSLKYSGWKEYQVGEKTSEISGKKIKFKRNGGGEENLVVGNFIHPSIDKYEYI